MLAGPVPNGISGVPYRGRLFLKGHIMTQDIITWIGLAGICILLGFIIASIRGLGLRISEVYCVLRVLYDWEKQDHLKAVAEHAVAETPEERKKRKQREASKRYKETHDRVMGLDGKYHYIKK